MPSKWRGGDDRFGPETRQPPPPRGAAAERRRAVAPARIDQDRRRQCGAKRTCRHSRFSPRRCRCTQVPVHRPSSRIVEKIHPTFTDCRRAVLFAGASMVAFGCEGNPTGPVVPTLPPAAAGTVLLIDSIDGENVGVGRNNWTNFQNWNLVAGCVDLHVYRRREPTGPRPRHRDRAPLGNARGHPPLHRSGRRHARARQRRRPHRPKAAERRGLRPTGRIRGRGGVTERPRWVVAVPLADDARGRRRLCPVRKSFSCRAVPRDAGRSHHSRGFPPVESLREALPTSRSGERVPARLRPRFFPGTTRCAGRPPPAIRLGRSPR